MERTKLIHEVRAVKNKNEIKNIIKAKQIVFNKIQKRERRAKILDKTARNFLEKQFKISKSSNKTNGFIHGLGHGVGVVIHEWPNLKPKSEDVIPVGCVITIEPGLYFRGFGGVRIEDMILITKDGYKNLTTVSKELKDIVLK